MSDHLPVGLGYPLVTAGPLLTALCFVVGALVLTATGRRVRQAIDRHVLKRLPGYSSRGGWLRRPAKAVQARFH